MSFKNLWQSIIMIIVLFVSDDTLMFGTNANPIFETVKYVIVILLLMVLIIKYYPYLVSLLISKEMMICYSMCLLIFLTALINDDLRRGYYYKCIILLISCILTVLFDFDGFALFYERMIYILALISVVLFSVSIINSAFFSAFPLFQNSAGTTFNTVFVWFLPTSKALMRNYGIFREPGVYQMFLIWALVFNLKVLPNPKIFHTYVYILALVFTYSTTGYIALFCFLMLFLVNTQNNMSKRNKFIVIALVCVGICYVVQNTNLLSADGVVFNKFSNQKRNTTVARYASIIVNYHIWKQSPIFGAGLTSVESLFPRLSLSLLGKVSNHNTNTIMCELATFGIIYALIFVGGYMKFAKKISKNFFEYILVVLIILIMSCGERLSYSPITYLLMFYGFSEKSSKAT